MSNENTLNTLKKAIALQIPEAKFTLTFKQLREQALALYINPNDYSNNKAVALASVKVLFLFIYLSIKTHLYTCVSKKIIYLF